MGKKNAHRINNLWRRDPRYKTWRIAVVLAIASVGYWALPPFWQSLVNHDHYGMGNTLRPGIESNHGSDPMFTDHQFSHAGREHSTITCHLDDTGSDFDRRCHLQNICWDRREFTFVYFSDPERSDEATRGAILTSGEPRKISVRRNRGELGYIDEYLPLVERAGPIPLANATFSEHKVHIYFTSFWAENFGHALVDDIHPLFALMYAFKMVSRDSVFLYPREVADNLHGSDKESGSRLLHELAKLISDNGILRMDTDPLFSSVPPTYLDSPLVCMRHLLAGTGNLENLNMHPHINIVGSWPHFIHALLVGWRMEVGAEADRLSSTPVRSQLLVFIRKVGRRRFINLDMLVEKSKIVFGVETLVINPGEMSIVEQITVAQRATVTFMPCGGISFFNAFLREGATAIVADYWDAHEKDSLSMDGYFWDRILSGFQTLRYTLQEDDIVVEAPGNATARTWRDIRDYGATMIDLERAMRLIDRALYMAEHIFHIESPHIGNA